MKALILCERDDANGGYIMYQALKATGIEVEGIKQIKHPFSYSEQLNCQPIDWMVKAAKTADIVIFSQVCKNIMEAVRPHLQGKKVVVVHGGSEYRRNKPYWDAYCNGFATHTILSADNWQTEMKAVNPFMWMAIDTDKYRPEKYYEGGKLKIYHSPSSAQFKGTKEILQVVELINNLYPNKIDYLIRTTPVPHDQHIEDVRNCDIYIDNIYPRKDGNILGSWGTAAREAAALGKIVLTNDFYSDLYKENFGCEHELYVTNTPHELQNVFQILIKCPAEVIAAHQRRTRSWIAYNHNLKAAGFNLLYRIRL